MKIIHLHSELNFVGDSTRFENESIENIIIIFGKRNQYLGPYRENALFFSTNILDLNKIINICKKSDVVILYDLNFIKCYIANHIPNKVIIVWRFFGAELYSKIPDYVFSKFTLASIEKKVPNNRKPNNLLRTLLLHVKYRTNISNQFNKGVNRINYFAGLSDSEYAFLKNLWPDLPQFLQLSLSDYFTPTNNAINKKNKIIIGNNRSPFNNHLEILQIIEKTKNRDKYEFILLFNYGVLDSYANTVLELANKIQEIKMIEHFLPLDEFKEIYCDASAFVLNGYRQMAMANLFEAIKNNVKIYLNEKNVILNWLRKEGFLVFTISDFCMDIEKNNITLLENEKEHNKKQLELFVQKYSRENFQKRLLEIMSIPNK